jgi:hypothetical protein
MALEGSSHYNSVENENFESFNAFPNIDKETFLDMKLKFAIIN